MYGCYKIKQAATPITIFKKQLNTNQQCLIVNLATAPILYLVGAGAVMFWVMGKYMISFGMSWIMSYLINIQQVEEMIR